MGKWNIGMMGLKDRGFLYKYLNPMMIVVIPTKNCK
jgi:hypothetical protein